MRDETSFDLEQRRFLGRAYNLKTMADYGIGPDACVSADQARATVEAAGRFVAAVADLLGANGDKTVGDSGNDDQ